MKLFFEKFIGIFGNFFKIIDENRQVCILRSIDKDDSGLVSVSISPITSHEPYRTYPHVILNNPVMKDQFKQPDIKIMEAIVIAEGDIFIDSKEYHTDAELYKLKSIITKESWTISKNQLIENVEFVNRINKRFKNLNLI